MDEYVEKLRVLSEKSRIIPAEPIIIEELMDFNEKIPNSEGSFDAGTVYGFILKFLQINRGDLSFQCSSRIGECLCIFLQAQKVIEADKALSDLIQNPIPSNLFAIAILIKKFNEKLKNNIKSIVDAVLKMKDPPLFSSIVILCRCYSHNNPEIRPSTTKVLDFAISAYQFDRESIQLFVIKLLKKLVKKFYISYSQILSFMTEVLRSNQSSFVIEHTASLIALCAQTHDTTGHEIDECTISLMFLQAYQSHLDIIFPRFITMMGVSYVQKNYKSLFKFIRDNDLSCFHMLSAMLSSEVRKQLFSEIENDPNTCFQNLKYLSELDYGSEYRLGVAAYALSLTINPERSHKMEGASYFNSLFRKDKNLAIQFLQSSVLFVSHPPEDYPKINRSIRAHSFIISHIIASDKDALVYVEKENIHVFLERALKTENIFDGEFGSAFLVLSSLPNEFHSQYDINKCIDRFFSRIGNREVSDPKSKIRIRFLAASIALFLSSHPSISKSDKYMLSLLNLKVAISHSVKLAIYLSLPHLNSDYETILSITHKIHADIMKIEPHSDYIQALPANFMLSRSDLLHGTKFIIPNYTSTSLNIDKYDFAIRVTEFYPLYIKCLKDSDVLKEIAFLFQKETDKMVSAILIRSLCTDKSLHRFLPNNLHEFLMESIYESHHIKRIQIVCDAIAIWAAGNPNMIDSILVSIRKWKNYSKCFLYSALFAHAEFEKAQIVTSIIELNDMMKTPDFMPYACFSLSVLYQCQFHQLSELDFVKDQVLSLASIIHLQPSLSPFVLYYISLCFSSLLPLLSMSAFSHDFRTNNSISNTLTSFTLSKIPFSRQIIHNLMRSVLIFSASIVKPQTIRFPKSMDASLSSKIVSFGFIADCITLKGALDDYFNHVPEILLIYQMTNEPRAENLIHAIANSYVNADERLKPKLVKRLNNWSKLINSALTKGQILDLGTYPVEACRNVKICLIKSAKFLLPFAKQSGEYESIKSIVTSIAQCVDRNHFMITEQSCSVLSYFIEHFSHDNPDLIRELDSILLVAAGKSFSQISNVSSFPIKYLEFHRSDFGTPNFEPILLYLFNNIPNISDFSIEYMRLTILLIEASQSNKFNHEGFKQVFNQYTRILSPLIYNPNDHHSFACLFSVWEKLLRSYIWVSNHINESIPIEKLLSFILHEITNPVDLTRKTSARLALVQINESNSECINQIFAREIYEIIKEDPSYSQCSNLLSSLSAKIETN